MFKVNNNSNNSTNVFVVNYEHVGNIVMKKWKSKNRCNLLRLFPVNIYLLKVSNRNTKTRSEICSKLTVKTPERRQGVFIVNFEHISHLVLVFLLLILNM